MLSVKCFKLTIGINEIISVLLNYAFGYGQRLKQRLIGFQYFAEKLF